jgi:hypothetical protein
MSGVSVVSTPGPTHVHHAHESDSSFLSNENFKIFIHVLEKISLVALAAFAAYVRTRLFFSCFGAGVALGVYVHFTQKKVTPLVVKKSCCESDGVCTEPPKVPVAPESCPDGKCKKVPGAYEHEEGGGCSQGFLEQLTGVKLPPLIGLAANGAIMYGHIAGHSSIFVPLIGLNIGVFVGKKIGQFIDSYLTDPNASDRTPFELTGPYV